MVKLQPTSMPAGEFKAKCLQIMDDVASSGKTIIVTKHGKPVAQISPAVVRPPTLFGFMAGQGEILGDIVAPIDVTWNANE